MALKGFNKGSGASAIERTGEVTGMLLGKVVNAVHHGMNAMANPQNFQTHALSAVKAPVQKVEAKATMAFANADEGFGSTFSKAAAAARKGYNNARTMKPEKKNKGPSMQPG